MATERLSDHLTNPNLKSAVLNYEQAFAPEGDDTAIFDNIFDSAEKAIQFISREETNFNEGRTGGVMAIIEVGEEPTIAIREIGTVRPEKIKKYTQYALGKAEVCLVYDYLASTQNEHALENRKLFYRKSPNDEGTAYPGGAIKFRSHEGKEYIIAFSGYSQEDDQATVLLTAVDAGIISKEQIRGITRRLRRGIDTLYNSYASKFFVSKIA